MKRMLSVIVVFALLTAALPVAAAAAGQLWQPAAETNAGAPSEGVPETVDPFSPTPAPAASPTPVPEGRTLKVLDTGSGQVVEIGLEEFVLGSVASEMPHTWPDEALKAQAVASRSYALARAALNDGSDPDLQGADFSADPARHLGYVRQQEMQEMWGTEYETIYARLSGLVAQTAGQTLQYEGETALACYHAISNGRTEASENVWTAALPYLSGVDSALDATSPDYEVTTSMTESEVKRALETAFPDIRPEGDPGGWFTAPVYTEAGYLDKMTVCGAEVDGGALRSALGLRSSCFSASYADGSFTFVTKGYGHGVGLSQYGAYALALTGQTYDAILASYYPGTVLDKPA